MNMQTNVLKMTLKTTLFSNVAMQAELSSYDADDSRSHDQVICYLQWRLRILMFWCSY